MKAEPRVVFAVPEAEQAPVYHPSTKDPRECGSPMKLTPPKPGQKDPATARVVARWLFNTTDIKRSSFTLRGKAAKLKSDTEDFAL